ncbi:MAG: Gfo/Idh/MocA family oxidoreductase [Thermodesulfovibrionales bacterium]|nr:Gfo/Idh/MocA family oxidoreductase [Thermodesulfovibrionales bacterium]
MIKVGIIGVGYLGQHHVRVFSEIKDAKLIAVADINEEKAIEIANRFQCTHHKDFRELLKKVDAVSIVTPTNTHFPIALDCIKAGKDIFIEKPITDSIKDAEILIEEADKKGLIIQVGHIERFNPAVKKLYSLVESPVFFEAERLSPFMGRGIDVDIVTDLMIHDIDIILSIIQHHRGSKGFVTKDIKAVGAQILTDKIDVAKAWVDFGNNVHALMTAARISSGKSRKLKIYQKNSYIILDYQHMVITRFYKDDDKIHKEIIEVEKKEPLKEELEDFVKCLIHRRKPRVTAIDGLNALKIANKIIRKVHYNEAYD